MLLLVLLKVMDHGKLCVHASHASSSVVTPWWEHVILSSEKDHVSLWWEWVHVILWFPYGSWKVQGQRSIDVSVGV